MRAIAAALTIMLCASPAWAQTGFQDVSGGKKHVRTGLVCPASAGKFKLSDMNDKAGEVFVKFNCIYTYDCGTACDDEQAQVTIIGAAAAAVRNEWRNEVESNGFTTSTQVAPNWGAPYAPETLRQVIEGKPAVAALWSLGEVGAALTVSGMYAEKAAPSMEALVRKVQALNPRKVP